MLKDRIFRKKRSVGATSFTSTLEMMVCLAICLIFSIIGIPFAVTGKSIVGWVLTVVGVGGIIALLTVSIRSQWGYKPSYDTFLVGVFFFFVCLGVFIGIPIGMTYHSFWLGIGTGIVGLIAGYAIGIFAGLRIQHLGWFALIVNFVAAFGVVVIAGTALVMMVVLISA
jgi:hypothetical protein